MLLPARCFGATNLHQRVCCQFSEKETAASSCALLIIHWLCYLMLIPACVHQIPTCCFTCSLNPFVFPLLCFTDLFPVFFKFTLLYYLFLSFTCLCYSCSPTSMSNCERIRICKRIVIMLGFHYFVLISPAKLASNVYWLPVHWQPMWMPAG